MDNEEPEILALDEVPLGYEPIVFADPERDALADEFRRLREIGKTVCLADNGDGTLGLWELRSHFWIH